MLMEVGEKDVDVHVDVEKDCSSDDIKPLTLAWRRLPRDEGREGDGGPAMFFCCISTFTLIRQAFE